MARSVEKELVSYNLVNFREFANDKHHKCDDEPYGGGAGMVLKAGPLAAALDSMGTAGKRIVYLSPSGKLFNQALAAEFAGESELVLISGRYEGIDQRIIDEYVDDEISLGDYVLSSGETAALVIIDAVYRLLDGVINNLSLAEESHSGGLLEYPHYTRPEIFHDRAVPKVLLSGNHEEIRKWRLACSLKKTMETRPDLLLQRPLSKDEQDVIDCHPLFHGGSDGSC